MSRKPIDGTRKEFIDKEGYVVNENFIRMPDYKNEHGHRCIKIGGKERQIRNLVYTHFAGNGKGAEIQEGKAPQYKDGNKDNCAFNNLVIAKSKEEQKDEVIETADTEDEIEQKIMELFIEDNEATYKQITNRMKERHDQKVTRNQIASAKRTWKDAVKEAGQM